MGRRVKMNQPRIAALISGGRNGSLLLQSLLDGHHDIAQFPGVFRLATYLAAVGEDRSLENCAEHFVRLNPQFFDTAQNALHGMDRLGDHQSQAVVVPVDRFRAAMSKRSRQWPAATATVYDVLVALHEAYSESCGDPRPRGKKLVLVHVHTVQQLGEWSGPSPTVIFMERDPLPSLQSEIEAFLRYHRNETTLLLYWTSASRKLLEPTRVVKLGFPAATVRLEDLHRHPSVVMGAFCRRFNLQVVPSLYQSTFFGLKWWGDSRLKDPVSGLNPAFVNRLDSRAFFQWELACLESLLQPRLLRYGYPRRVSRSVRVRRWMLSVVPTRGELKCLGIIAKNLAVGSVRVKLRALAGLANYRRAWTLKRAVRELQGQLDQLPPLLYSRPAD